MEDYNDEIFASDSDGYAEYFSKKDGNRGHKTDKNQKEAIVNFEECEW